MQYLSYSPTLLLLRGNDEAGGAFPGLELGGIELGGGRLRALSLRSGVSLAVSRGKASHAFYHSVGNALIAYGPEHFLKGFVGLYLFHLGVQRGVLKQPFLLGLSSMFSLFPPQTKLPRRNTAFYRHVLL